ncbi:hypothetical protein [Photobacterium sp. 1_MG-2023]|uniref:hypothetical protein n=1 Tax=Photobacterium sp. 1_MG-2023 TaxID=3062646 RepID=UPI0026E12B65|nr:hypothetical protein [Photobacterium sp. 1_MG-2023]MDO6708825.1 hypothetical protein [Photobacterium sp. 1_MG-2023]
MISGEDNFYNYLISLFPTFKQYWSSDDNYNLKEDGSFDLSGLCAEFSQYYIDDFQLLGEDEKKIFFDMVESVLASDDVIEYECSIVMANCLKSCFIENISQTEAGENSKELMGKLTRDVFNQWHNYP